MTAVVPTLSPAGWVSDPADKADFLMADLFTSNKHQTFLYGSNVTSASDMIQKNGKNVSRMIESLRDGVEKYLSGYFDFALVTVKTDDSYDINSAQYGLTIAITVNEAGKSYSISNLLTIKNSKFAGVIRLGNE